jgi:hypothetical protein
VLDVSELFAAQTQKQNSDCWTIDKINVKDAGPDSTLWSKLLHG